MRIISGKNKGRVISAPKSLPVRPTTDYAKESLFNILNNYYHFDEITVLDLFSGTGNISYEFASRGSKKVVAVDEDRGCVNFINKTAIDLEYTDVLGAHQLDAILYLKRSKEKFDLIFADPPYDFEDYYEIIDLVYGNDFLNDGGLFVLEHNASHKFEKHEHFFQSRRYGNVNYTFFNT